MVIKLVPTYADGYTNRALTEIAWQRYPEAEADQEKALTIAPGDARALYYRGLVEQYEGKLHEAVADLLKVTSGFPRSRDAHREPGYAYFQLRAYPEARTEYEAVQAIDLDDLSAHYNLAILYRRLGIKDRAELEAARFSDEKDDPAESVYALAYLRGMQRWRTRAWRGIRTIWMRLRITQRVTCLRCSAGRNSEALLGPMEGGAVAHGYRCLRLCWLVHGHREWRATSCGAHTRRRSKDP